MPEYLVTIASGNKYRVQADSPEEAKRIIRSRLQGIASASKNFRSNYEGASTTRNESGQDRHEFLRKARPVKAEKI